MTDSELLNCLNDRPCKVCKFHSEKGCSSWACVFEQREPRIDVFNKVMKEIQAESINVYAGRVDGKTDEVVLLEDVMKIIDKYCRESDR